MDATGRPGPGLAKEDGKSGENRRKGVEKTERSRRANGDRGNRIRQKSTKCLKENRRISCNNTRRNRKVGKKGKKNQKNNRSGDKGRERGNRCVLSLKIRIDI